MDTYNNINNINKLPIKAFVINLDDSKSNYEKQKPYLENLGLEVHRFSGINGNKDEHLKYTDHINPVALEFSPKSVIGCSLSHILLAKYISENYNDPYYLIFEDDSYPIEEYNNKDNFNSKLNEIINEVNIIDHEWDIISLCSFGTSRSDNYVNIFTTCTAAYLINNKSVKKLATQNVTWHNDIVQNILYHKYKSKKNLFITDETDSTNREKQYIYLYKIKSYIISLCTVNNITAYNYISYKLIRFGNTNYTLNNLLDALFIMILCIIIFYIFKYIK